MTWKYPCSEVWFYLEQEIQDGLKRGDDLLV